MFWFIAIVRSKIRKKENPESGIAGLQFSIIAAKRGNRVILAEKEDRPGGQMILAGMTPHKEVVLKALDWFVAECGRVGVGIFLDTLRSARTRKS